MQCLVYADTSPSWPVESTIITTSWPQQYTINDYLTSWFLTQYATKNGQTPCYLPQNQEDLFFIPCCACQGLRWQGNPTSLPVTMTSQLESTFGGKNNAEIRNLLLFELDSIKVCSCVLELFSNFMNKVPELFNIFLKGLVSILFLKNGLKKIWNF
jgi:hypothetical protein